MREVMLWLSLVGIALVHADCPDVVSDHGPALVPRKGVPCTWVPADTSAQDRATRLAFSLLDTQLTYAISVDGPEKLLWDVRMCPHAGVDADVQYDGFPGSCKKGSALCLCETGHSHKYNISFPGCTTLGFQESISAYPITEDLYGVSMKGESCFYDTKREFTPTMLVACQMTHDAGHMDKQNGRNVPFFREFTQCGDSKLTKYCPHGLSDPCAPCVLMESSFACPDACSRLCKQGKCKTDSDMFETKCECDSEYGGAWCETRLPSSSDGKGSGQDGGEQPVGSGGDQRAGEAPSPSSDHGNDEGGFRPVHLILITIGVVIVVCAVGVGFVRWRYVVREKDPLERSEKYKKVDFSMGEDMELNEI